MYDFVLVMLSIYLTGVLPILLTFVPATTEETGRLLINYYITVLLVLFTCF